MWLGARREQHTLRPKWTLPGFPAHFVGSETWWVAQVGRVASGRLWPCHLAVLPSTMAQQITADTLGKNGNVGRIGLGPLWAVMDGKGL